MVLKLSNLSIENLYITNCYMNYKSILKPKSFHYIKNSLSIKHQWLEIIYFTPV